MQSGKKTQVEKPILKAFNRIKQKEKKLMIHLLFRSLIKIRPLFGFISKRLGREVKIIPMPLFSRRQTIVSLNWYVISIKLVLMPSLYKKVKYAISVFPKKSNIFALARNRRRKYDREVYKHRLNGRWR
jgi:ribosomal protein S7